MQSRVVLAPEPALLLRERAREALFFPGREEAGVPPLRQQLPSRSLLLSDEAWALGSGAEARAQLLSLEGSSSPLLEPGSTAPRAPRYTVPCAAS